MVKTMSNAGKIIPSTIFIVLLFGMNNPSGLGWEVAEPSTSVALGFDVFVDDADLVEELEVCGGETM
jgi:hypothetical protein